MEQGTHSKPRVLFVASTLPCPPCQGSHLRILHLGRQMRRFADVTFAYVGRDDDPSRVQATRSEFGDFPIFVPQEWNLGGVAARVRHKFRFHWPWHHAPKVSRVSETRFLELHRGHDVTWFHTLPTADAFRFYSLDRSVMDLDDLNHRKFEQMYATEMGLRGKVADRILAWKWARWERRAIERFAKVAVCSEADRDWMEGGNETAVVPNGFEPPAEEPVWQPREAKRLGFIGHLGYEPNARGLRWFAENIWPIVRAQVPEAEFRIVGHRSPRADLSDCPGCRHLGFVEDTSEEFDSWSAMVVPVQFGGGTRLKILEAFSRKCPVVSTPVGAHGIDVHDGAECLIRASEQQFAQGCIQLLQDSSRGRALAESAYRFFIGDFTWEAIGNVVGTILNSLVASTAGKTSGRNNGLERNDLGPF